MIQRASSEARKATTSAMSSGWPMRLQRLHAEREVAAFVGLGEARHVGRDDAGRDRVDADAARAQRAAKCFTSVSIAPLVAA